MNNSRNEQENLDLILGSLMKEAQDGNSKSYDELLTRLSYFLKGYLAMKVHQYSEAEHVSQEVLLAVHKSRHTYDLNRSFMTWFLSITHYKIIDFYRSQGAHSREELLQPDTKENLSELNPLEQVLAQESQELIRSSIKSLDKRSKMVLTMLKIEGKKISEVSSAMGLTQSNVKVIAHRAFEKLRIEIERKYGR